MHKLTRRTALLALTAGAGAALVSGCRRARAGEAGGGVGRPAAIAPGTVRASQARGGRSVQQIVVAGATRQYVRYEPAGLDSDTPAPLVLVLHGATGSGAIAERLYDFREQSDAHGFVVAYPDALGQPTAWVSRPGGKPDDVDFIRALVAQEAGTRPIDPARTFVCGHSSGAMMSYRLAGEASDLFPAVGIVAGSIGYQGPNGAAVTIPKPPRPVSVIHFHGTDDTLVRYNGGSQRGNGGVISVADSIAFWVAQDGCDPTPSTETIAVSRRETYSGGRDGSEVILWTIKGGGHGWPKVSGRSNVGVSAAGISATDLIWRFFEAHGRNVNESLTDAASDS